LIEFGSCQEERQLLDTVACYRRRPSEPSLVGAPSMRLAILIWPATDVKSPIGDHRPWLPRAGDDGNGWKIRCKASGDAVGDEVRRPSLAASRARPVPGNPRANIGTKASLQGRDIQSATLGRRAAQPARGTTCNQARVLPSRSNTTSQVIRSR